MFDRNTSAIVSYTNRTREQATMVAHVNKFTICEYPGNIKGRPLKNLCWRIRRGIFPSERFEKLVQNGIFILKIQ